MSFDKIPGRALLGFSDFFEDSVGENYNDVNLGAGPTKPPPTRKPPPGGKKGGPTKGRPHPAVAQNTTVSIHKKVLAKGRATVTRAAHSALKANDTAKKTVKPVTVVGGVGRTLSPKQRQAVANSQAAAAKAQKATAPTKKAAVAARKSAIELAKKLVAQKAVSASLRGKGKTATRIRGAVIGGDEHIIELIGAVQSDLFPEFYAAIGAGPHPDYPGYLDNGMEDPAYYVGEDVPPDPGTGDLPPDAGAVDPGLDMGAGADSPLDSPIELPPPPPMDQYIADMVTAGGIKYNGEKGTPDGHCVSYGLAMRTTDHNVTIDTAQIDGTEHYGYVWGVYDLLEPANGGVKWGSNLAAGQWNHIHGRYVLGDQSWHNPVDASEAFGSHLRSSPRQAPYGPLIGNPVMKDFKGMRVDGAGNMFWLPQEAPEWLTFPLKQAAALTAKAEREAQEKADRADQARLLKEQLDAEAEQRRVDAANALAQSQETSSAAVAQSQAETAAQQSLVQQAQADTQSQTQTQQQDLQERQFMLEQARREAEMQQQMAQMQMDMVRQGGMMPGGGGGMVPGYDDEVFVDDGANVMLPDDVDPFAEEY